MRLTVRSAPRYIAPSIPSWKPLASTGRPTIAPTSSAVSSGFDEPGATRRKGSSAIRSGAGWPGAAAPGSVLSRSGTRLSSSPDRGATRTVTASPRTSLANAASLTVKLQDCSPSSTAMQETSQSLSLFPRRSIQRAITCP